MIFGPPKAENWKQQILREYCIKNWVFFHTGSAVQSAKHELINVKISQNWRMTKLVDLTYEIHFLPLTLIQFLYLKMIRTPQMVQSKYLWPSNAIF